MSRSVLNRAPALARALSAATLAAAAALGLSAVAGHPAQAQPAHISAHDTWTAKPGRPPGEGHLDLSHIRSPGGWSPSVHAGTCRAASGGWPGTGSGSPRPASCSAASRWAAMSSAAARTW